MYVTVLVTFSEESWFQMLKPLFYEDCKQTFPLDKPLITENYCTEVVEEEGNQEIHEKEENWLQKASRDAIGSGKLDLCEEGVGGTYFLLNDDGKNFGVFKPIDEEPGALNNPKEILDDLILPPGGGAKREVAAYLLDQSRAGVPETYFLNNVPSTGFCTKNRNAPKSGSVQKYINSVGSSSSFGSSSFLAEDVHKIGILDIRILNLDRNDENILVVKEGDLKRLVPIDHTYSLPPSIQDPYFEWMYWKQAKIAFSEDLKDEVKKINIADDAKLLRSVGIEEESIMTMRITTTLLKKAVAREKTLFQIAEVMCAAPKCKVSKLEEMVSLVKKQMESQRKDFIENSDLFMELLEKEIDELLY